MAKGSATLCAVGEGLRFLLQLRRRLNRNLVGENVVAVLVAQSLALGVKVARVHGRLKAPVVEGQREVVAYPGNVVLFGASFSSGLAAAQSGHSRSSNSMMATLAPAGGLSAEAS